MFEGKGMLMEQKYQHSELMFEETFCIVSSNDLPAFLSDGNIKGESKGQARVRRALRTRCNIHVLENSHEGTEKFPYGAPELAKFIDKQIQEEEHDLISI